MGLFKTKAKTEAARQTKERIQSRDEKALLGEEAASKLGTYEEAAGGGTPIEKNEDFTLVDNVEEADKIRAREKHLPESQKSNIRVKQPRNPDGTFGYNSQNRRGVRYPSRGRTVPHFLREYVAKWYKEGKTGDDLITSKDENLIMAMDMTMNELVEKCKYYIDNADEQMLSALSGSGDFIEKNKLDGTERSEKEKEQGKKAAEKRRMNKLAKRKTDLSYQEGKGANSKKTGPKFAKKSESNKETAPTAPVNSETSAGGYTDANGKTYTKEQMEKATEKFNEAFKEELGVSLTTEDLKDAKDSGLIDNEIWDSLFEE